MYEKTQYELLTRYNYEYEYVKKTKTLPDNAKAFNWSYLVHRDETLVVGDLVAFPAYKYEEVEIKYAFGTYTRRQSVGFDRWEIHRITRVNITRRYSHRGIYFRRINTYRHFRDEEHFRDDNRNEYDNIVKARRRGDVPHRWDDLPVGRTWGKSWKDYTKARKQWMKNLK